MDHKIEGDLLSYYALPNSIMVQYMNIHGIIMVSDQSPQLVKEDELSELKSN